MSTRGKTEVCSLVKDAIKELFASQEFMNQITKTISDKIEQKLISLEETVEGQAKKISEMEQQIDGLKQQEKINNICIYGVPESNNETPCVNLTTQIIKMLNAQTGLDLTNENITTSYRIGGQVLNNNKPRPIIVQLINHNCKVLLLKNAKKFKGKPIFLSEDLTRKRRELLSAAKNAFGARNA